MVARKHIESYLISLFNRFDMFSLYLLRKTGPLFEDGWFRSVRENSSIDLNGNPIPWFTYPAIEFISKRIKPNMSVFEFGAGNSTYWWASRVGTVISVEHDKNWYEQIRKRLPGNVQLHHTELAHGNAYAKKIDEYRDIFDIVVIDGRDRINCAKHALNALKPDGVIIWDNSERPEYLDGYNLLYEKGFRKLEFVGLIPTINYKSETGIFYRSNNCFSI